MTAHQSLATVDSSPVFEINATLTPRETVNELDKYIVGQQDAKRAVAIALRNRWRRMQLGDELRDEVTPKNILMIGPTGVGKTEIARRLAKLAKAPFIKVEATKFTEIGYVGRDVESIIRDLIDIAVKMTREAQMAAVDSLAETAAEERILDALLPPPRNNKSLTGEPLSPEEIQREEAEKKSHTRQLFRKQLREGLLDDKEIEVKVAANVGVEIMAPPGMEEMTSQLQNIFQNINSDRKRVKKLKISDAKKILRDEEAARLVDEDDVKAKALRSVEQHGIVFIDEIDKITRRSDRGSGGGEVSREGVQRDLLPLIEGSTVTTKYGMVKTDHILFIASGAFHLTKPSDLIPELQGRLPIRVELNPLKPEDFVRILTEPNASLTKQYEALLLTEGVTLKFTDDAVKRIAEIAFQVNEQTENIGARRLHTVMERLLENISYTAPDQASQTLVIDAPYVETHLGNLAKDEDLSQYIL